MAVFGAAMLAGGTAGAASLGHSRVVSGVNQPLKIDVPLLQLDPATADTLRVGLAAPQAWKQAGLTPPVKLSSMRVRVLYGATSQSRLIQITSDQAFDKSVADLLITVRTAAGSQVYQVSILTHMQGANSPLSVVEPSGEQASKASRSEPAGKRIEVEKGDTMFAIAQRNAVAGVSVYQMMIGLQRANQQAFIRHNLNLVKAGAVLTMPDKAALTAISDAEARRLFVQQVQAFEQYRQRVAGAAVAPLAGQPASQGKVTKQSSDVVKPRAATSRDEVVLSGGDQGADSASDRRTSTQLATADSSQRVEQLEHNVRKLRQAIDADGTNASSDAAGANASGTTAASAGQAGTSDSATHSASGAVSGESGSTSGQSGRHGASGSSGRALAAPGSASASGSGSASGSEPASSSEGAASGASSTMSSAAAAAGATRGGGAASAGQSDTSAARSGTDSGAAQNGSGSAAGAAATAAAPGKTGTSAGSSSGASASSSDSSNTPNASNASSSPSSPSSPSSSNAASNGAGERAAPNQSGTKGTGSGVTDTSAAHGSAQAAGGNAPSSGNASSAGKASSAAEGASPGGAPSASGDAASSNGGGAASADAAGAPSAAQDGGQSNGTAAAQPDNAATGAQTDSQAHSQDKAGKDVSWFEEHLLASITAGLALIVLIIAWLLRRMNTARDEGGDGRQAQITEAMVQEKLDQINLDLRDAPADESSSTKT